MVNWLKTPKNRRRGRHIRRRRTWWQRQREHFWPSMGVRSWGRWALLKLLRAAEDPHRVALGFAFGAALSFTPWVGLHVLMAWALCRVFGGGYLAAFLGTWVGNPWTFPLMWLLSFEVGKRLLGLKKSVGEGFLNSLTFERIFVDFRLLMMDVLLPMTVGGLLVGSVVGLACYTLVRSAVTRYRDAKGRRLLERRVARSLKHG